MMLRRLSSSTTAICLEGLIGIFENGREWPSISNHPFTTNSGTTRSFLPGFPTFGPFFLMSSLGLPQFFHRDGITVT